MAIATEQILVEIVPDTSALDSAIDQLTRMGAIDSQLASSFKSSTAEINKQAAAVKTVAANSSTLTKSFESVASAAKNVSSSFAAGFQEGVVDALQEAGVSAKEFSDALLKSGGPATQSVKTLKQELRSLVEQMALAKANGDDVGQEYESLVQRAGKLKDAIGDVNQEIAATASDTSNIDGLIGAAQGIAGAFSIAQGATALFGTESEALQQSLVKLNAIMAITQGLQSVGNTLQKESAAMRFLDSTATKAQVIAQRLYSVVVGQSTGALKAFRIALASTGIGLLVIALGALVANWDKVTEAINGVSDAQKELQENATLNADAAEQQLEAMEGQEEILKQQGKTEQEILKSKIDQVGQIIQYREQQLQAQVETTKAQIEAAKRNREILSGIINFITVPINLLFKAVNAVASFFNSDFKLPDVGSFAKAIFDEDEVRAEGEKSIAETQKQIDKAKNQQAGFQNALTSKEKEEAKKRADAAKAANEQRLKDQVTVVEKQLIAVKKGSEQELELQKKLLVAKANLDMNGAKSGEERKLIAAKLNQDLLQLEADFEKQRIDIRIKGIEADLVNVEEGSREELRLKQQLIAEQAASELSNTKLSEDQKTAIRKKAFADQEKLQRDFNKKLAAEALQDQISLNKAEIENRKTTNEDKLLLEIANIELAAEAEVQSANGNADKIKEIYANRDAQIRDAKIAFIDQAVQHEIDSLRIIEGEERRALDKRAQDSRIGFDARIDAVKELSGIEVDEINKQIDANRRKFKENLITEQQYNDKYNELVDQRTQKEEEAAEKIKQLEKDKSDARLKVAFAAAQAIADTFSMIAEAQTAKDEERIAGMKKTLQDEIDAGAITEKEAKARQQRIDAEEKKARIKAAERAKQIAIFNSIINTAQAVVQALASAPPPFNFVLAGIVGAMGLAQTALIASKPIPKFRSGKKGTYEGLGEVGEAGTEIVKRDGRMYVVDKPTITWLGSKDIVYTPFETKNMLTAKPEYKVNKQAMAFSPDKDGNFKDLKDEITALHKTMKSRGGVTVNVDKNGISEFFEKTMSEIHYFNSRYTFRNK